MERKPGFFASLKEIGEWLRAQIPVLEITPEEVESARQEGEQPVVTALRLGIELFKKFARYRGIELGPKVAAFFDIDYVLREPLREFLEGRPGAIPRETLLMLRKLQEMGVCIGFVTDQPLDGQQVARVLGEIFGYSPMKKAIMAVLGEETPIFSAGKRFFFWFRPPKRDPKVVEELAERLTSPYQPRLPELIVYFGDRWEDCRFWCNVRNSAWFYLQDRFVFVKLPNLLDRLPPRLQRLLQPLARFIP